MPQCGGAGQNLTVKQRFLVSDHEVPGWALLHTCHDGDG